MSVAVATAVNTEGRREIIGMDVGTSEDGAFWLAFLRSLSARGLHPDGPVRGSSGHSHSHAVCDAHGDGHATEGTAHANSYRHCHSYIYRHSDGNSTEGTGHAYPYCHSHSHIYLHSDGDACIGLQREISGNGVGHYAARR